MSEQLQVICSLFLLQFKKKKKKFLCWAETYLWEVSIPLCLCSPFSYLCARYRSLRSLSVTWYLHGGLSGYNPCKNLSHKAYCYIPVSLLREKICISITRWIRSHTQAVNLSRLLCCDMCRLNLSFRFLFHQRFWLIKWRRPHCKPPAGFWPQRAWIWDPAVHLCHGAERWPGAGQDQDDCLPVKVLWALPWDTSTCFRYLNPLCYSPLSFIIPYFTVRTDRGQLFNALFCTLLLCAADTRTQFTFIILGSHHVESIPLHLTWLGSSLSLQS